MRDLLQLLRDELLRQLGVARQDCIEEHRAKGVLALSGDGTWGQTANARFCTTTLMGLSNRCFVAVVHLTHDPRLKASTGFMIKVECSSKGMEAIGLETCARTVQAAGVEVTHWILDGDTSLHAIMTAVYSHSKVCPCCNHYFKNVGKHLRKFVASKAFPDGFKCHCAGKSHVRTASSTRDLCGCPTLTTVSRIVSKLHAAKTHAGDSPDKFADRVEELIRHLGGDHTSCTFHSTHRCTGEHCGGVKHASWRCSCADPKCTLEAPLCWGEPCEPPSACRSKVPWTSRSIGDVTCPGHLHAFEAKLREVRQGCLRLNLSHLLPPTPPQHI